MELVKGMSRQDTMGSTTQKTGTHDISRFTPPRWIKAQLHPTDGNLNRHLHQFGCRFDFLNYDLQGRYLVQPRVHTFIMPPKKIIIILIITWKRGIIRSKFMPCLKQIKMNIFRGYDSYRKYSFDSIWSK